MSAAKSSATPFSSLDRSEIEWDEKGNLREINGTKDISKYFPFFSPALCQLCLVESLISMAENFIELSHDNTKVIPVLEEIGGMEFTRPLIFREIAFFNLTLIERKNSVFTFTGIVHNPWKETLVTVNKMVFKAERRAAA